MPDGDGAILQKIPQTRTMCTEIRHHDETKAICFPEFLSQKQAP